MTESKSLVDIAYDVLRQEYEEKNSSVPMPFGELLLAVGKVLGMTDENRLIDLASRFYTALTTDGRFVIKENNTWVLREHELYENVHIDMNDVYSDEPAEDELGSESEDKDLENEGDDEEDDEDNEEPNIISAELDEDEE